MTEWYWNNSLTLVKMEPNKVGKAKMVKCSPELQKLLNEECERVWKK